MNRRNMVTEAGRLGDIDCMPTKFSTSAHKKELFLQRFPEFMTISATSLAVGINRKTFQNWVKEDEGFAGQFDEVREALIERLEARLYEKALDKTGKDSIIALIVALKANKPEKYQERRSELELTHNITVIHKIPEPDYQIETSETKLLDNKFT